MPISSRIRNALIVAFFSFLAASNAHIDAMTGTPAWMTVMSDWFIFPVAAALAIILLSPGEHHLNSTRKRVGKLARDSARLVSRKLFLRSILGPVLC